MFTADWKHQIEVFRERRHIIQKSINISSFSLKYFLQQNNKTSF